MLHFFKFSSEVEGPVPAKDVYTRSGPGKGWPEECPPLRAASALGWDVPVSFDMVFLRNADGSFRLEKEVEVESDWTYGSEHRHEGEEAGGAADDGTPLVQKNAWFWDKDQVLPHVISSEVHPHLRHQVKVSTFLFLATDPNELLLITDIPNARRPFRVMTALVETDWYPASYPWHCVLELDPAEERIVIEKGSPLCRLLTVRRESYFAREMAPPEFERFFQRGQEWLLRYGKGEPSEMMDITGAYARQQSRPKFLVIL
jgi:hypothetical protein